MDDSNSELARFRQQWKEEVTARGRGPSHSSAAVQPLSAKHRAPASSHPPALQFPHVRRISSTSKAVGLTGEGEQDEESEQGSGSTTSAGILNNPALAPRSIPLAGSSTSGAPQSALEHYEKAVEKESQGSLGESLSLYRKAFRMDEKVDSQYKEKYFPRKSQAGYAGQTAHNTEMQAKSPPIPSKTINSAHHSSHAPCDAQLKEVGSLIASFAGLRIVPSRRTRIETSEVHEIPRSQEGAGVEEEEEELSPLAKLPSELLLQVLRMVAVTDIASFARLAQVCKAFAYLVATEQSIWREACEIVYSRMLWDWRVTVSGSEIIDRTLRDQEEIPDLAGIDNEKDDLKDEKRVFPNDDEEVTKYGNNWKTMFMRRPRVRFNGLYISTCNYLRPGASTNTSWNTPVHIVTYYRYLRFYPDGTVLSLLSSSEPSEVVPGFSKTSLTPAHLGGLPVGSMTWGKYVLKGRWRISPDGSVDIETQAGNNMDRYLFRMALRVKATRGPLVNKLAWESFWSWNRLTDDLAAFSLKNDKSFYFSRVGRIEREIASSLSLTKTI